MSRLIVIRSGETLEFLILSKFHMLDNVKFMLTCSCVWNTTHFVLIPSLLTPFSFHFFHSPCVFLILDPFHNFSLHFSSLKKEKKTL